MCVWVCVLSGGNGSRRSNAMDTEKTTSPSMAPEEKEAAVRRCIQSCKKARCLTCGLCIICHRKKNITHDIITTKIKKSRQWSSARERIKILESENAKLREEKFAAERSHISSEYGWNNWFECCSYFCLHCFFGKCWSFIISWCASLGSPDTADIEESQSDKATIASDSSIFDLHSLEVLSKASVSSDTRDYSCWNFRMDLAPTEASMSSTWDWSSWKTLHMDLTPRTDASTEELSSDA